MVVGLMGKHSGKSLYLSFALSSVTSKLARLSLKPIGLNSPDHLLTSRAKRIKKYIDIANAN